MKSVMWNIKAPENAYCITCTAKATKMIVIGKEYKHALAADQFFICDECAEKLAKKLQEESKE